MIVKVGNQLFNSSEVIVGVKLEKHEIERIAKWPGTDTDVICGHPNKVDRSQVEDFQKEFVAELNQMSMALQEQNEALSQENAVLRKKLEEMKTGVKPKSMPMGSKQPLQITGGDMKSNKKK